MDYSKYKDDVMQLFSDKKMVKICAPMVRYSKLQFRNLVREYNCDLCFTPMILADSFCQSEKARINEFSTNIEWAEQKSEFIQFVDDLDQTSFKNFTVPPLPRVAGADLPVIVQYAANKVHDFVGAAHMVSPFCSGVDLNCGCPQKWAKSQGIGCIMLENPQAIYDIVKDCRNQISKPFSISVKMRILPDIKKTISICQQLEHTGVSFLTIHARTAKQHSVGPINIQALELISETVKCPVVANGGIKTLEEADELHEKSKCKGIMAASAILTNPALFSGYDITPLDCIQKWIDICFNSTLNCKSYLNINGINFDKSENLTFQCFHHHLVFMLEKYLPKYNRKIFNNLQTFETVLEYLDTKLDIRPNLFPIEKFKLYDRICLNYENRNEKYLELKNCDTNNFNYDFTYNSDITDGKYFNSKKSIDDCDTYISNLFI